MVPFIKILVSQNFIIYSFATKQQTERQLMSKEKIPVCCVNREC